MATIDVSQVIEHQQRNRLVLTLVGLAFLLMLCDGYDLQAIAFAAPSLIKDWGINKASFGIVFSVGLFGMMLGGLFFGYVADRIGRRPALLLATSLFSTVTLATVLATTITQLATLRFIAGLGIGGLIPICMTLIIEYASTRFRATVVAVVMTGYVIGASAGGIVAAWFVPAHGWEIMFYVGGLAPILLLPFLLVAMPESVKYLVLSGKKPQAIARIVNAINPSLRATADSVFVLDAADTNVSAKAGWGASFVSLFSGKLARITPVLWISYIASSTTLFFLVSWLPVLIVQTGRPVEQAAIGLTTLSIGGAFGGLLASRIIDRLGVGAMAPIPFIAALLVVAVGHLEFSNMAFMVVLFVTGVFSFGGHFGMLCVMGTFYPSANRANAVGWGTSMGSSAPSSDRPSARCCWR